MVLTGVIYALLQDSSPAFPLAFGMTTWIIFIALLILEIYAYWRVFEKAGQPGWAAIVPIYNMVVMARVAGKPGWWAILLFIPLVNIVIMAIISGRIAKNFGYGLGFAIGLFLLSFIFYPILGYGGAQYQPAA